HTHTLTQSLFPYLSHIHTEIFHPFHTHTHTHTLMESVSPHFLSASKCLFRWITLDTVTQTHTHTHTYTYAHTHTQLKVISFLSSQSAGLFSQPILTKAA